MPAGACTMDILYTILIGFIIGLVARFLKPGDDKMGIIATTLVGVGGSFLGTYGGRALGLYGANQVAGFIAGVVGAVILLVILALVKRK